MTNPRLYLNNLIHFDYSSLNTSEKIDQVSPSIELSDELFQDFPLSDKKNLQDINEEFDITWGSWDISTMESL